jgi:hypothetical protein
MQSEGCWPADGMIAAASPYWEFGTSRWQLEEQDISAKGSNRCDKVSECKGNVRMSALGHKRTSQLVHIMSD